MHDMVEKETVITKCEDVFCFIGEVGGGACRQRGLADYTL